MAVHDDNLIWIDLEMTGLDPSTEHILEVATIVTDSQLEVLAEGPLIAVHQSEEVLASMDHWNREQHSRSGLVERVRESTFDYRGAELATLEFLRKWVPGGKSPMCGNSVCHDRRFLARLMPELEEYFHYRNLDVSTLKELVRRWAPEQAARFSKQGCHLALEDIRESIEELKFYRQFFLVPLP